MLKYGVQHVQGLELHPHKVMVILQSYPTPLTLSKLKYNH